MTIQEGSIVAVQGKTGKIVPYRNYTKAERLIRWIGRMLRSQSIARYHELTPIGVMFNGRVLANGTYLLKGMAE